MPPDNAFALAPATGAPRDVPWWRFGMVWFVVSGPALVVVAGFVTMAIAFRHADVELHEAATTAAPLSQRGALSRAAVDGSARLIGDGTSQRPAPASH